MHQSRAKQVKESEALLRASSHLVINQNSGENGAKRVYNEDI
jgi:hypothetical protein